MATASAGALIVNVAANTAQLTSGLQRAGREIGGFRQEMQRGSGTASRGGASGIAKLLGAGQGAGVLNKLGAIQSGFGGVGTGAAAAAFVAIKAFDAASAALEEMYQKQTWANDAQRDMVAVAHNLTGGLSLLGLAMRGINEALSLVGQAVIFAPLAKLDTALTPAGQLTAGERMVMQQRLAREEAEIYADAKRRGLEHDARALEYSQKLASVNATLANSARTLADAGRASRITPEMREAAFGALRGRGPDDGTLRYEQESQALRNLMETQEEVIRARQQLGLKAYEAGGGPAEWAALDQARAQARERLLAEAAAAPGKMIERFRSQAAATRGDGFWDYEQELKGLGVIAEKIEEVRRAYERTQQITEGMRRKEAALTPEDSFRRELDQIRQLRAAGGLLTDTEATRAAVLAQRSYLSSYRGPKADDYLAGFATAGSGEALAAINRIRGAGLAEGKAADAQQRAAEILEKYLPDIAEGVNKEQDFDVVTI